MDGQRFSGRLGQVRAKDLELRLYLCPSCLREICLQLSEFAAAQRGKGSGSHNVCAVPRCGRNRRAAAAQHREDAETKPRDGGQRSHARIVRLNARPGACVRSRSVITPPALDRERREALEAVGKLLGIGLWPDIPVRWNRRLRRAGRALIDTHGDAFEGAIIELSPAYFEVYPRDLRGILVHEAVHIGLALLGKPCGHGPRFREVCLGAGGLLHSRWLPGRVYRYRCPICEDVLERRRRMADAKWCAACADAAEARGEDPYEAGRAMQLVGTSFVGPEEAATRADSVCPSSEGA